MAGGDTDTISTYIIQQETQAQDHSVGDNNVGAGANRGGGGGFGLQEVSKDDEVKKPLNDEDNGELQSDLFRYFFNIVIYIDLSR